MPQKDPLRGSVHLFSESELTDIRTPDDLDTLIACLADHRRRRLIDCLSASSGELLVEQLVEHIPGRETGTNDGIPSNETRVEITTTLLHSHLPKMAEADVVEFDRGTNTVSEGNNFDVAASLLEVV